jgi:hypothetical protein
MTNENVEMATAEANAKIITDMDKAQADFMAVREEKRKAEEMKTADK